MLFHILNQCLKNGVRVRNANMKPPLLWINLFRRKLNEFIKSKKGKKKNMFSKHYRTTDQLPFH